MKIVKPGPFNFILSVAICIAAGLPGCVMDARPSNHGVAAFLEPSVGPHAKRAFPMRTLREKTELPYVFVAEVESWGAASAKRFAPNLDLEPIGGPGVIYAVVRVTRIIKAPADKMIARRLLVQVRPDWFSDYASREELSRQYSDGPSQELFRTHYLGKEAIFFAGALGYLQGVGDRELLMHATTSPQALHEPMTRLTEVLMLVGQRPKQ